MQNAKCKSKYLLTNKNTLYHIIKLFNVNLINGSIIKCNTSFCYLDFNVYVLI